MVWQQILKYCGMTVDYSILIFFAIKINNEKKG